MFLATASAAAAHGGMEVSPGFVSGLWHPLAVPAHCLAILAIAMLQGRHGLVVLQFRSLIFAAALFLGLSATLLSPPVYSLYIALLSLTIITGLLVALGRQLPLTLVTGLSAIILLLVGFDSGVSTGSWGVTIAALAGIAIGIILLNAAITELVAHIHDAWPNWTKIGVRVVASWVAAIAALILSLQLFT